jgi:hypothetical protein
MTYFYPALVKGLGYANTVKAQYMTVSIALAYQSPSWLLLLGSSANSDIDSRCRFGS